MTSGDDAPALFTTVEPNGKAPHEADEQEGADATEVAEGADDSGIEPGASKSGKKGKRPFPAATFEEALELPLVIHKAAPGQNKIRRLTLFDAINKSPDSGASRQLISNANRY